MQYVIRDRLADDRDQDECRYILRFCWQLAMPYTEVTLEQLREHVHAPKLAVLEDLIRAIRSSEEDVGAWIDMVMATYPVVLDHSALRQMRLASRLDET